MAAFSGCYWPFSFAAIVGTGSPARGDFSPDKPDSVTDPAGLENRKKLLCPDLRIGKPSEMYLDRDLAPGQALLRSTNDIRSRGMGPMEVRGHRDRPHDERDAGDQAPRRRLHLLSDPGAPALLQRGLPVGGAYWKIRNPLRFELWRVNAAGKKIELVRTEPKQFYFRDLVQTNPASTRSPDSAVYPACANQNPRIRHVTLGTSVGWSDIWPRPTTGSGSTSPACAGCFAYVLHLDPGNVLFELSKKNNYAQRSSASLARLRSPRLLTRRCDHRETPLCAAYRHKPGIR